MRHIAAALFLVLLTSCIPQTTLPAPTEPVPTSTTFPSPEPSPTPTFAPTLTATPMIWCSPAMNTISDFRIIGYLPDYRELNAEWGKCLTDIIYFSAQPQADGSLDTSLLNELTLLSLRAMKIEYGTHIYITVGGWERSNGFAAMTANAKTRKAFEKNLLAFALEHRLDGVDFDWEFPENETEFENYILLLTETRAAFNEQGMTVSVALSPWSEFSLARYDVVDRIHIMSYDRGPRHSTYEQAVDDLRIFLDAGISPQRLALGLPFYGRKIDPPHEYASYADLVALYHPGHDTDEIDSVFFNGIDTVQRKTCLAVDEQIAGIMIWELGQDTWDETSLLRAIAGAVTDGCSE